MKTATPLSRKLLLTTALTAAGIVAISGAAQADNWTDHTATTGSITIDTGTANTTNITQHDHFVKVQGDGDINAGWTVNVAQPSTSAKYVLYDIEGDATFIMGTLNANGEIYIFDQNGVVFGRDSRVDVGSIITSTGHISDENILSGHLAFENIAQVPDSAIIIENGAQITVADAGLAAFVAPTVTNSGIINAKLGRVVLASAERVTLDFYGDNLIEVALDGELADGLVENAGTINAQGGQVVMAASVAKQAVDNVVNMSGVINASSATVQGGKIVLSGGKHGTVNVSGKMDASGKDGGGKIDVTGENVTLTDGSEMKADGKNGEIKAIAEDTGIFAGTMTATGEDTFIETSAETVEFAETARILAAKWLIDPITINIGPVLSFLLELQLNFGNGGVGGDAIVETNLPGPFAGHIFVNKDISWSGQGNLILNAVGSIFHNSEITASPTGGVQFNAGNNIYIASGAFVQTGAGAIDFNQGGTFHSVDADSIRTTGGTINLMQNAGGSIQNAINAIENTGSGRNTIDVGAGTYNEALTITEDNFTLAGTGGEPGSGTETSILPGAGKTGVHVIGGANAIIEGLFISGGRYGVRVDNADNALIKDNFFRDQTINAVHGEFTGDQLIKIIGNDIADTGDDAIRVRGGQGHRVFRNQIAFAGQRGIEIRNASDVVISKNKVNHTGDDGIFTADVNNLTIRKNVVKHAGNDGIDVNRGKNIAVEKNIIKYTDDDGIDIVDAEEVSIKKNFVSYASDIGIDSVRNTGLLDISGNKVFGSGSHAISATDGDIALIYNNIIKNAGGHGILADGFFGAGIFKNKIWNTELDGIHLEDFGIGLIGFNKTRNTGDDGIEVVDGLFAWVGYNDIKNAGYGGKGDFIYGADGIHIRNVWNPFGSYSSPPALTALDLGSASLLGGDQWSVMVNHNKVENTGDDGIQVLWSGNTQVHHNDVLNAGTSSGARLFGGDGINIVTGSPYFGGGSKGSLLSIYSGPEPIIVEVTENNVENSLDDGIQVVGANEVLIDNNIVLNSGDDGINLMGFAGFEDEFFDDKFSSASIYYYGWPQYHAVVTDNGVNGSGGDGVQSEGFDTLLAEKNVIVDSAANGLFVSGFNNGVSTVSENIFAGNDIGAQFESGLVDLTGIGNEFVGGRVGLRFAPHDFDNGPSDPNLERFVYNLFFPYPFSTPSTGFAPLSLVDNDAPGADTLGGTFPPTNFGGTIGSQSFNGQSQFFVELDNEAFYAPGFPTILNGLDSTYVTPFGTITPSSTGGIITADQLAFLEDHFQHFPDTLDLGLFWFGTTAELADISQEDIFNFFSLPQFGGTGGAFTITGLPLIPGGPNNLNNITPFAGGGGNQPPSGPAALNAIAPAAGGENEGATPQQLNEIETAAGEEVNCWGDAINAAYTGRSATINYGSGFEDILNEAAGCQSQF